MERVLAPRMTCIARHCSEYGLLAALCVASACRVSGAIVTLETGSEIDSEENQSLDSDAGTGASSEVGESEPGEASSEDATASTETGSSDATSLESLGEENSDSEGEDPQRMGIVVAAGYGGVRVRSLDHGQSWVDYVAEDESGQDEASMRTGICYGDGRFVITGGGVNQGELLVSDNGLDWTSHRPQAGRFQDCVWTGEEFVAVADNTVYRSPDGEQWQLQTAEGIRPSAGSTLAHGPSGFVLVREDAGWWSNDGQTWLEINTEVERALTATFGGGKYIVAGYEGQRSYSEDGKNWFESTDPEDTVKQMHAIHDGRRFILAGDDGRLRVSDDGITWRAEGNGAPFGALTYTGVKYVGTSWTDRMHITLDLQTWEEVIELPGDAGLTSIEFGEVEL